MNDYSERVASEWHERAPELAAWVMKNMVNRKDIWGRYLKKKYRGQTQGGQPKNRAITAPFSRERGKISLQANSIAKHFRSKEGDLLGLHSCSSDGLSRWLALDIDLHDDYDMSVTKEGNFAAAVAWHDQLKAMGFDPLLMDSNGSGGFHMMVFFENPMGSIAVRSFCEQFVANYSKKGLDQAPDLFPGNFGTAHRGSWLRIFGRHHTRDHFSRVYNDEPWSEDRWLDGHDAIDRILELQMAPDRVLEKQKITPKTRTVCLDFDGVIHSYQSGWQGEAVISDPPIHKVGDAIKRLRKDFRVVVYSARCRDEEGVQAIKNWLDKHLIEVDEVCRHKPPAFVYVDDRAVRFTGDWNGTIRDIYDFRK